MKKFFKILGMIIVAIIVGPILIGLTMKMFMKDVPPPGKLYDVGGFKLHMDCRGDNNGMPTIVFESGSGAATPIYQHLVENLSKTHRICTYDRAGLAWSEPSGVPSEIPAISHQLHALLEAADVQKPFVLAGHSIAGLFMKDYYNLYPEDVLAIGFLDASHPDQNESFGFPDDIYDDIMRQISMLKTLTRLGLTQLYNPQMTPDFEEAFPTEIITQLEYFQLQADKMDSNVNEMLGVDPSMVKTPKNMDLGNMPVLVVTAGEEMDMSMMPTSVTLTADEFRDVWRELQADHVALSTNSTHIIMDSANHMSMFTTKSNADMVSDHIRDLVSKTQK
ncbi:MAG: alpha/beta fold hydrolase [Sphingomonadales bacterium]|jgi:pimeloyl-ACP methyl ester carboxylesterase